MGFVGEAFLQTGVKGGADGAGLMGLLEILAEINDFDARKRARSDARSEGDELVLAFTRVVVSLE